MGALQRDSETQLGVAIGIGAKIFCSGTAPYYLQTWARKNLPDRIVSNAQGTDVPTEVWDVSLGWDCPSIMAGELLATGVSQTVVTNNNLFRLSDKVPRIYTWRAHGILTLPNGANAVFRWQLRWNLNQGGVTELTVSLH